MQPEQTTTAPAIDPGTLADIASAAGEFTAAEVPATVAPPAPVDPQLAGMIGGGLLVTFGMIAKLRGSHWALDEASAEEAGAAYAAVMVKYFPNLKGGPEFTAVMITVALLAPRVMMDKAKAAQGAGDGAQPE